MPHAASTHPGPGVPPVLDGAGPFLVGALDEGGAGAGPAGRARAGGGGQGGEGEHGVCGADVQAFSLTRVRGPRVMCWRWAPRPGDRVWCECVCQMKKERGRKQSCEPGTQHTRDAGEPSHPHTLTPLPCAKLRAHA